MKGYRKIMKVVAVILAFALIFSGVNVPGTALAATTAATATWWSLSIPAA